MVQVLGSHSLRRAPALSSGFSGPHPWHCRRDFVRPHYSQISDTPADVGSFRRKHARCRAGLRRRIVQQSFSYGGAAESHALPEFLKLYGPERPATFYSILRHPREIGKSSVAATTRRLYPGRNGRWSTTICRTPGEKKRGNIIAKGLVHWK